jgi:class 3 adenylate cyclase/tetratricopeptide (TPR) repeat protein
MCGSPLHAQGNAHESRRNVTVLFIDVVGSTALAERLDPESLRQVMDRYFEVCRSAIIEHGGVLEKFIGDAVLAVFGAMIAHEDDAVRAVRAAERSLTALHDLNADIATSHQVSLEARCGICSGEVVVITAPGRDYRVVGDPVNTASRLQTAAAPGEILIGAETAALVRGHARIDEIPPLRLKGKAQTVQAWRVIDPVADPGDISPTPMAPLIGRDDELSELQHGFRRVIRGRQVCLVTLLGTPGIGKSRLVSEFLAGLPEGQATVMSGRCSAYGKGITYAPLADMLSTSQTDPAYLSDLVPGDTEAGRRAASSLATIMKPPAGVGAPAEGPSGLGQPVSAGVSPAGIEEIAWAVRHLLDVLGKARPVVMVWEDLHWAEETLLDLIDDVATWLTDVPVLLLCVARTELLDAKPSWGGGKPCAMTLELGPLSHEHSSMLVSELSLAGEVQAHQQTEALSRIATQCDGNPLFAELMLDVFAQTTAGTAMPPTIHALLSARVDQLPVDEQELLAAAAVIGRDFTRAVLEAMIAAEGTPGAAMASLMARLVRRRVIQQAGPGSFRFAQTLLRDTIYSSIPKARRERWHMFLADWYANPEAAQAGRDGHGDGLLFAHHAEAACLLRRDLLPGDPGPPGLAVAAADALASEGMNALERKDLPAAVALLERARALLPAGDGRHVLLALHLCDSWIGLLDEQQAMAALSAAEDVLPGHRSAAVTCAIQRCIVSVRFGSVSADTVAAQVRQIELELESQGDDLSWCRYHQVQAYLCLASERAAAADAQLRLALDRARAMDDAYEEERLLCAICEVSQWAPGHTCQEGLELCHTLARRFAANGALLVPVLATQAYLESLGGHLDAAREAIGSALAHSGDLHLDRADATVLAISATVESLAGEHGKAETQYRRATAAFRAAYHTPDAMMLEASTARAVFEQGRTAEAEAMLATMAGHEDDLDLRTQIGITALHGRIASQGGSHGTALSLARRAGELTGAADDPCLVGEALFDLAIVARAAGQADEAATAATSALRRFEGKGAMLPASRVRDWLSARPEATAGDSAAGDSAAGDGIG